MEGGDPWLSLEQLHKLTGLKQKSAQRKWLKKAGITFWVRADGVPIVPLFALMGTGMAVASRKANEPDFDALLRAA